VIRSRLTWLLVGAVFVLLLFAGLDALRSWLGDEDAHRTVAPTHQVVAPKNFAPCDQQQLEASIEVRGGIATTVLRHVSVTACHQHAVRLRLTIWDRAGRFAWRRVLRSQFEGNYAQSTRMLIGVSEQTVHFVAPNSAIPRCHRRGPFVALAQIGPYAARARGLSASEIGCP
jgi:hypothetical protein